MDPKFITTGYSFKGHSIEEYLGIVTGIHIRSKTVFGLFESTLKKYLGGNASQNYKMAELARKEAFNNMILNADELGANAIIGLKFESSQISDLFSEIVCYGTAVKITASKENE